MGIKQDVFGLEQIYRLQVEGQWSTRGDVWTTPSPFMGPSSLPIGYDTGYFSGGKQPSNSPSFPSSVHYSFVARIDYSSDTTTVPARGSLPQSRDRGGGVGNQDFGYHVGGIINGAGLGCSIVNRIDYSNDSSAPTPKGNLFSTQVTDCTGGAGNESFGYLAGGIYWHLSYPNFYEHTYIQRIDYSNDNSAALHKGNLATNCRDNSGTGNQSFGYFAGGFTNPFARISTVQRSDYSNDTATVVVKGPLSSDHRRRMGGVGNADFGYYMGGYDVIPGGNHWTTIVDRIDYSNDTATASPKGPLTAGRAYGGGTGNREFGYYGGGEGNNNENQSTLERITFANDTATAVVRGPLIYNLRAQSASSSKQNANPVQTLQPASSVRDNVAPQGTDFGYFGAGSPSPALSSVDRIDYSNDTETASPRGNILTVNRIKFGAVSSASHGYFGAGKGPSSSPSNLTSVDRIDFSNDTATALAKGPLNAVRYNLTATGNASFGYFIGGTGGHTIVDRIDYSNDTATASPKGPLSANRYGLGSSGAGNQSFGYVGGGGNPGLLSSVDRIDYGNDTATATPKGPLSVARNRLVATGNASFGYYGGGQTPTTVSTVDRIDYSNDTATAAAKGPLSVARNRHAATSDASFGYFAGGGSYSTVDRIDYSNDTATAAVRGPLSKNRSEGGAASSRAFANPLKGPGNLEVPVLFGDFSSSSTQSTSAFAYFGGGNNPALNPTNISTVDRVNFNNDTATAVVKGSLSAGRAYLAATSNINFGYFGGGTGPVSTVERLDYSNDNVALAPKGPLSLARIRLTATGNNDFGYFAAGSPGPRTTIDRIDYSNDTATAVEKGPLSAAKYAMAAIGNQSFGYFSGGRPTPIGTKIERLDYSNDTAAAVAKGPLDNERMRHAAGGSADFGYFGGGEPGPGPTSKTSRIDYSNDTATAVGKGNLSAGREELGGTQSSDSVYFGGGKNPVASTVDRMDFSSDTSNYSAKGPLSAVRHSLAAVSARGRGLPTTRTVTVNYAQGTYGTPNTGYFTGGLLPGDARSTVDRIDYSNDTATVVKGPLNTARYGSGSTSSPDFGYIAGGSTGATISSVERIDYLNDTATASPKGPLSAVRNYINGTGNKNFGYFGGASQPSSSSKVERIDYSNDAVTAVEKGPLSHARAYIGATGNQDFGYFAAGGNPKISTVDRIDYASDTVTAVTKGPLSIAKSGTGASGNSSFGYFAGGFTPSNSPISTIDRIDYSNDTETASPKGPLTTTRFIGEGATGSSSSGYFAGGGPGNVSTVERIDYDNDTATAVEKGPLSLGRNLGGAVSARECGFVPIGPSVISNAPVQTGAQDYRGYIFGGEGDPSLSPSYNQPTQRIDFLNDTATAVVRGAPAGGNLYYNFAVGNRNYAYAANLGSPSPASVQRFDYSNETAALVVRGAYNTVLIGDSGPTSSVGGYNAAATGNHDYGWTNGGYKLYSVPAPSGYYSAFSQIDRIDYSNDTANASRRSYTTNRFGTGSANGTNDYGYWMGGSTSMPSYSGACTKVDRTDYANDTTNAVAKGNLAIIHGRESDSIANSSYAWIAGGRPYGSTRVDRFDYSNDTATAVEKGNLSVSRYEQSTTGSQSYGYFCGGSGPLSSVDRIDYSNDTATASPKGPLVYKNRSSSGASTTYNSLSST